MKQYFRLVDIVKNHTGFSKKEVHTFFKNKFFPFIKEFKETLIENPESLNDLTDKGKEIFLEEVKNFIIHDLKIGI